VNIRTYVALCFATFLLGYVAVGHAGIPFRQPKDPGPYCIDSRYPCDYGAGGKMAGPAPPPPSPKANCWACTVYGCSRVDVGSPGCYWNSEGVCTETAGTCVTR
jgi:hypothetical protein